MSPPWHQRYAEYGTVQWMMDDDTKRKDSTTLFGDVLGYSLGGRGAVRGRAVGLLRPYQVDLPESAGDAALRRATSMALRIALCRA